MQNTYNKFKYLIQSFGFSLVLFVASCSSPQTVLYSNLPQQSANQIVLLLGQNNISATKTEQKDGTYNVMVSQNDLVNALNISGSQGGPKQQFQNLGELFPKDGYISSPTEEHERVVYALNQEISAMLSELNGVVLVKTNVSIPSSSDGLLTPDDVKPTASVLIKYKRGQRIDLYLGRIKNLVSHAIAGLNPDQVEVVTVEQKNDTRTN